MIDPFSRIDQLPPAPPEPVSHQKPEKYHLVQILPPLVVLREPMKPWQVDWYNYWHIRWNLTTRYLDLDQFEDWLHSFNSRRQIPESQS